MQRQRQSSILGMLIPGMVILLGTKAVASVMPIGAFTPSTLITFTGLPDGTEVNGLTVSGVLFTYSLGNGQLEISHMGPGLTNNINPPNTVTVPNQTQAGTLTILLPSPALRFEYGYAILRTVPFANATTVSVFSGATLLGSLSFDAAPDPAWSGGLARLESTSAFDRVAVTFNNSGRASDFAMDNIGFGIGNVPEPSTFALLALGLLVASALHLAASGAVRPRKL